MALLTTKFGTLSSFRLKFFLGLFVSLLLIGCGSESKITVATGNDHSLVIDNEGQVYAAGDNKYGQLGFSNTNTIHYINGNCESHNVPYSPVHYCEVFTKVSSLEGKNITAITAGNLYSLALDSNGKVYAAGSGFGSGMENIYDIFTEVTSLNGKNITAITVGNSYSLALDNNGKVYAAGDNYYGQLGLGNTNDRYSFTEVSSLEGKNIVAIATGGSQSFAISSNGKVYATGSNSYGQLGLGDTSSYNTFTEISSLNGKNIIAIAVGFYHSIAIGSDSKVYVSGNNGNGQLGLGDTNNRNTFTEISSLNGKNITAIAAGDFHSFVIGRDGKIYAAGHNYYGQLGLGDNNDRSTFTEVTLLSGKHVTAIATGDFHSFVIDSNGKIYATGYNLYGRLGLGDTTSRNTFTEITH